MYLEAKGLRAGYGKKEVLRGVSLGVEKKEIVALLGHNGAGKSTLLRVISGFHRASSGNIIFDNADITHKGIEENVKRGIILVPQGKALFSDLSVEENLKLGAYTLKNSSLTKKQIGAVYELFPILRERKLQKAGSLSGGEQRVLSLAISLMVIPKVLLLDEPSLGLSPAMRINIMEVIHQINQELGVSVILVEENVAETTSLANRVYIMKTGEIVFHDNCEQFNKRKDLWDFF